MNILHLDSSILGEQSVTRNLSKQIVSQLTNAYPVNSLIYHDLNQAAPNHLTGNILAAAQLPAAQQTNLQQQEMAHSSDLLAEFLAADILVIGAPMYNFSIASTLKAWFDRVLVSGKTFKYTSLGPVGLMQDKQVIIASSRGSIFSDSAMKMAQDHHEKYLVTLLNFVGITDINFIRAEGVNVNSQIRAEAIGRAEQSIQQLVKIAA